jgi:hypothetical protein
MKSSASLRITTFDSSRRPFSATPGLRKGETSKTEDKLLAFLLGLAPNLLTARKVSYFLALWGGGPIAFRSVSY